MADDETRARAVVIVMQVFGTAHREEEWAHANAEAVVADLDAAGLLGAPAAQPAPFTDLTARLAAADQGWAHMHHEPPSSSDYIRFLAKQIDAFQDHASPAAPADDEAAMEKAIYAGWHEFRYPRTAEDEPGDAFKRGVRAALAALGEGEQK